MDVAMVYTAFKPIFFVVIDYKDITKPEINGFGAFWMDSSPPRWLANAKINHIVYGRSRTVTKHF